MPDECEALLPDGLDLMAEEMGFGQGWNSPSHTKRSNLSDLNQSCLFHRACFHTLLNAPKQDKRKQKQKQKRFNNFHFHDHSLVY